MNEENIGWDRDRQEVLAHLRTYSVKISLPGEEFALASGGRSRLYIDAKKTTLHRKMCQPIGRLLRREVHRIGSVDVVAGVVLGGAHLASLTGACMSVRDESSYNIVFVRKEEKNHGTHAKVEAPWAPRFGERCVVLEDVLSTGASAEAAIVALRDCLYQVVGVVTLIDRRPAGARTDTIGGVPLRHVFNIGDLEIASDVAAIV